MLKKKLQLSKPSQMSFKKVKKANKIMNKNSILLTLRYIAIR